MDSLQISYLLESIELGKKQKTMEHILNFDDFLNEAKVTYSKYDVWVKKPNADIYDSDWKKLWDYFNEEFRRGNEIEAGECGRHKIMVDYSKISNYWKKWFDTNMVRTEQN